MRSLERSPIPAVLRERKRFKQRIKNSGLLDIPTHDHIEAFTVRSEDMQRRDQGPGLNVAEDPHVAATFIGRECWDHAAAPLWLFRFEQRVRLWKNSGRAGLK